MTTQDLKIEFYNQHRAVVDAINTYTEAEFMHSFNGKWTPGQQVQHLIVCLQPLAKVLASKEYVREKFGVIDRPTMGYDGVIDLYKAALVNGGKAPDRFLPEAVAYSQRQALDSAMEDVLQSINIHLDTYSETELDTLVLPHPLLGKLTIREMFFMMIYHAVHHREQMVKNLMAAH